MTFVPKLLEKNRSKINNTYIFKHYKTLSEWWSCQGMLQKVKTASDIGAKRYITSIFSKTSLKNECFNKKQRIFLSYYDRQRPITERQFRLKQGLVYSGLNLFFFSYMKLSDQHITAWCCFSIPPGNIGKPLTVLKFREVFSD